MYRNSIRKTQYEAYINAYPTSKKWNRNSVDVKANELMKNVKIMLRLEELRKQMNKKVVWNITRALNEINYVLKNIKKM